MLVRIIKLCFINGALRHPGQTIALKEGQKVNPKCMIEIKGTAQTVVEPDPEPVEDRGGKTRKQLMQMLDAAGVQYGPRDRKEDLQALLEQVIAAQATGGKIIAPKIPEVPEADSVI